MKSSIVVCLALCAVGCLATRGLLDEYPVSACVAL